MLCKSNSSFPLLARLVTMKTLGMCSRSSVCQHCCHLTPFRLSWFAALVAFFCCVVTSQVLGQPDDEVRGFGRAAGFGLQFAGAGFGRPFNPYGGRGFGFGFGVGLVCMMS